MARSVVLQRTRASHSELLAPAVEVTPPLELMAMIRFALLPVDTAAADQAAHQRHLNALQIHHAAYQASHGAIQTSLLPLSACLAAAVCLPVLMQHLGSQITHLLRQLQPLSLAPAAALAEAAAVDLRLYQCCQALVMKPGQVCWADVCGRHTTGGIPEHAAMLASDKLWPLPVRLLLQ